MLFLKKTQHLHTHTLYLLKTKDRSLLLWKNGKCLLEKTTSGPTYLFRF